MDVTVDQGGVDEVDRKPGAVSGYVSVPFAFTLNKTARLKFILKKEGPGTVHFDYFYCKYAGEKDPLYDISPLDGIFIGRIVKEGEQETVLVSDAEYPPGPAAFLPNRYYERGAYRAAFHLSGEFSGDKDLDVARLQVTDAYGGHIFSSKDLKASDFPDKQDKIFSVPFELKEGTVLNFHVHYEGHGRLRVKRIVLKEVVSN